MSKRRTRTVAVVAGLGAAALVLGLALKWRGVYYATYPNERLLGVWRPVAEERGSPNPLSSSGIKLKAVLLCGNDPVQALAFVEDLSYAMPALEPSGQLRGRSKTAGPSAGTVGPRPAPRDTVLFPDMSNPRDWTGTVHDSPFRTALPHLYLRFRFDDDGRLILENDAPFLPFGGTKLVLEREFESK